MNLLLDLAVLESISPSTCIGDIDPLFRATHYLQTAEVSVFSAITRTKLRYTSPAVHNALS